MTGPMQSIRRQKKEAVAWTRFHDVSLGLVVGILTLLMMLLVASAGWGQARSLTGDEPNFWGMVRPEAEELAAVGFAGSGLGAAAFVNGRTMPKLHGPMWHMADVEGGYASIRSTVSPLKCGCFTADGGRRIDGLPRDGVSGPGRRWGAGVGTEHGRQ
jgi:hypothetical protein